MALWARFTIPFLEKTTIKTICVSDMTSIIMQGIDDRHRPYLAMCVLYGGELRVGFIIQRYPHRCDEWEYGVLEQLDVWKMPIEQYEYMINQFQSNSPSILDI